MARNLRSIDAERWARRPSALVKVAGKRYATEHLVADEYEGCRDDFSLEDPMPDENMEEDVGWHPGPIDRCIPPFAGPKPGPAVPGLDAESPARELMRHLLTPEFKYLVCKHTYHHVVAWRKARGDRSWGKIECAFDNGDLSWLGYDPETGEYDQPRFENIFDIWLAAKLKVAQLKPEIPASALWGHYKSAPALYGTQNWTAS